MRCCNNLPPPPPPPPSFENILIAGRGPNKIEICKMQISQVKNVHRCAFLTEPAGIFCTLLASTSPISKRLTDVFFKNLVVNNPHRIRSGTDATGFHQQQGCCTNLQPKNVHGYIFFDNLSVSSLSLYINSG